MQEKREIKKDAKKKRKREGDEEEFDEARRKINEVWQGGGR